jgi:hypothetical protein
MTPGRIVETAIDEPDLRAPSRRLLLAVYRDRLRAAWLFVFTAVTLNLPILDAHGFRQTQTAISVYWMLHEHVFINYLTPVLTAPWRFCSKRRRTR